MPLPKNAEIDALYSRNASSEWILSEKRYLTEYTVQRRKKYPFGIVCLDLTLSGEKIEKIVISGDFFGTQPVGELENALLGQSMKALPALDPSPYIAGMTREELTELLLGI